MDGQESCIPWNPRKRPFTIVADPLKAIILRDNKTQELFFGDWAFDKLDWKPPTTKRTNTFAKIQFKKREPSENRMILMPASAWNEDIALRSNKRAMDKTTLAVVKQVEEDAVESSKNEQQKRHRPLAKRLKLETDQDCAEISSAFSCLSFVTVKADPCAVLPVEVWYQILSYLPPSQMAKASLVSMTWLEYTRSHPIWRTICEIGDLGVPKRKYKSFMAIACANSYWTCEFCFSHTRGRPYKSSIPLPVPIDELGGEFRSICADCRVEYYATHDQKPFYMSGIRVEGLRRWTIRVGQKAIWPPCGGSVGLVASERKIATSRHSRCAARSKDVWESRPTKKARKEE